MHTRSRTRSVAVPRPPQSIAALLPAEIVDCIFSHFDFDYSVDGSRSDRIERERTLSMMSVVAEGWKGPARRLLCRTVCVWSWNQLAEGVPEWARGGLQNSQIDGDGWEVRQSEETAGALFHFLRSAPSLRLLRIYHLPFASFNPADSMRMRTTHLLSRLRDLAVFNSAKRFPHSVISDILATSNRQISHLHLRSARRAISPIPSEQLDFGGNLRYLHVGGPRSIEDFQPLASSLVGLREMRLAHMDGESGVRVRELLAEVAPSLEKLTIGTGDVTGIVESFPLLTRLTRLWIPRIPASSDSLLLPPSLVSLQFVYDDSLLPLFDRWNAKPALLPATLQQIHIRWVNNLQTFEQLPPVAKFVKEYRNQLFEPLRRLSPRTSPFKALEVYFVGHHLDKVAAVEAECERLEVEFHRRDESLD